MSAITKKKAKKPKVKPLTWWKTKAWDLFSIYIRRKYSNEDGYGRCYTCGIPAHWKQLQAGHAIAGRNNAVLLDEEIVRPQCGYCNGRKAGMHHVFLFKLKLEQGSAEEGDAWYLKKLVDSNQTIKRTRGDYEEIIEELKVKIEAL